MSLVQASQSEMCFTLPCTAGPGARNMCRMQSQRYPNAHATCALVLQVHVFQLGLFGMTSPRTQLSSGLGFSIAATSTSTYTIAPDGAIADRGEAGEVGSRGGR